MCPKCGLPMSYAEPQTEEDDGSPTAPQWVCDGPNDNTDRAGCGNAIYAKEV